MLVAVKNHSLTNYTIEGIKEQIGLTLNTRVSNS